MVKSFVAKRNLVFAHVPSLIGMCIWCCYFTIKSMYVSAFSLCVFFFWVRQRYSIWVWPWVYSIFAGQCI